MDFMKTLEAKSDQLNNIDLIGGARIIKITGVDVKKADQPVTLFFEGDNGKPWKPGLTMRRVIAGIWGKKKEDYIGRKIELFRDPEISMAGQKTGGTRIKRMSHMDKPVTLVVPISRGKFGPYTVHPLIESPSEAPTINVPALKEDGKTAAHSGTDTLKSWWKGIGGAAQKELGATFLDEMKLIAAANDPISDNLETEV